MRGPIIAIRIIVLLPLCFSCNRYQRLGIRAKLGDRRAMYEYGTDIWAHTSGRQDEVDEAIKWITKAAEKGEVEAMYKIGAIHAMGGAPAPKAVYWFRKGAEAGDRFSMIKLAEGYRYGRLGLPKNQVESDRWYDAASKAKKPGDW